MQNNKYYWIIDNDSSKSLSIKKNLLNYIPENWIQDYQKSEFIFVIGGDGTVLRNKKLYQDKKIIPINGGNFGFYAYFNKNNLKQIIHKISNDSNFYNPYQIKITINEKSYYSLNEILIRNDKVMNSRVYINGFMLENFKGTGLMFSTQSGSTAHSKNANGAIICPKLNVVQMIEIEPITQKKFNTLKSPLILNKDVKICLKSKCDNNCTIIIDGEIIHEKFKNECCINCVQSEFRMYKPYGKNEYWKKIKSSFIRE